MVSETAVRFNVFWNKYIYHNWDCTPEKSKLAMEEALNKGASKKGNSGNAAAKGSAFGKNAGAIHSSATSEKDLISSMQKKDGYSTRIFCNQTIKECGHEIEFAKEELGKMGLHGASFKATQTQILNLQKRLRRCENIRDGLRKGIDK